jgi:hypothetical protein
VQAKISAVHQNQPVGGVRFLDTIEGMTGQRQEAKSQSRPRQQTDVTTGPDY